MHLCEIGSARKHWREFRDKKFPADKQFTIWWINSQWDSWQKNRRLLTEQKLDDIGVIIEHTPRKSLKLLAQVTGVSKSSARTATQLKLRPYKTTVIHARLAAARCSYQGSFLQLVSTVCRRRWDRSATDILFWWSVVSLAGIHKYAKVRTSLHSERYRPSGMLTHRQNSYMPRSKRRTGRREAQSRGIGQQSKKPHCIIWL
jgi:hypothetical protein